MWPLTGADGVVDTSGVQDEVVEGPQQEFVVVAGVVGDGGDLSHLHQVPDSDGEQADGLTSGGICLHRRQGRVDVRIPGQQCSRAGQAQFVSLIKVITDYLCMVDLLAYYYCILQKYVGPILLHSVRVYNK